jgi:hypothetical protein
VRSAQELLGIMRTKLNYESRTSVGHSFLIPLKHPNLLVGGYQFRNTIDPAQGSYVGTIRRVMFFDAETLEPAAESEGAARLERAAALPAVGWVRYRIAPSLWDSRIEILSSHYDVLMPLFASGHTDVPAAGRTSARKLLADLDEMSVGQRGYYRAVGPEFFGWLDKLAT